MKYQPPPINERMYAFSIKAGEKLATLWILWLQKLTEFIVNPTVNYLKLDTATTITSNDIGTFRWNQTDFCGELVVSEDSVLQIGEEEYFPLVINNTGVDIPNGTLVGFDGIDGGVEIQPYIADGTFPPWYIAGLTTQIIANNKTGRVSKFGYVRDINTTGSTVSETWLAGDVLYAHPTSAGKLTKVKPTAPNLMIPTAVVRKVDASTGVLLARVLPQQRLYYGVFSDSTTQAAASANTVYPIIFDTTDISSGVSRGTPTSRIIVANSGLYNFQFSVQLRSSNSSAISVFFWPRINGADVTNSASEWIIKSNSESFVPAWNFVLSLTAGQYFELVWAASNTGITLGALAAQTSPYARPAIPSVILTVTQANQ